MGGGTDFNRDGDFRMGIALWADPPPLEWTDHRGQRPYGRWGSRAIWIDSAFT